MQAIQLFLFVFVNMILLQKSENVSITKNNLINILLLEYNRNPFKWQNKLTDVTNSMLNEHLVHVMNEHQHLTDVQAIYNEAISKMYDHIPAQDLVEQFWKIYKKSDIQSFITMTRAQLALYWRYRLDKIQDPHYVLLAAHCLYKIKTDVFFTRLNESTQSLVDATIKSLPTSLQYLFSKREFCLSNYLHTEFIYQSTNHKIQADVSQVLTSTWRRNLTDYMGVMEPIFEETVDDNLSDLNLALVSKNLKGYIYRLPEYNHQIAANNTKQKLQNYLWTVELVNDNQLAFRQDEYLMCDHRGVVYGLKDKTIYDRECQWNAEECDGKTLNCKDKK